MEIVKTDVRAVTLERYSIEREASGEPVTVRAELLVSTPTMSIPPVWAAFYGSGG